MMHFPQAEAITAEEAEDRTDKSAELNDAFSAGRDNNR